MIKKRRSDRTAQYCPTHHLKDFFRAKREKQATTVDLLLDSISRLVDCWLEMKLLDVIPATFLWQSHRNHIPTMSLPVFSSKTVSWDGIRLIEAQQRSTNVLMDIFMPASPALPCQTAIRSQLEAYPLRPVR